MPVARKEQFITLKEAAELSGYSPDYLGQLIRNGKLEGEQVYMNVAWMTTKDAVEQYLSQVGKKRTTETVEEEKELKERIREHFTEHWPIYYQSFLYAVIALNVLFILFLLHIASFSIEKRLQIYDESRLLGSEETSPAYVLTQSYE
jgi:hypothetical protein